MAALSFRAIYDSVALTAATAKTVVQVTAPSNHRVRVKQIGVFFDGATNTAVPVKVELLRQTTAGTMSSLTPAKLDSSLSETVQSTAQHTATVEPTASTVLRTWLVHPQSGYQSGADFEVDEMIPGAGRVGLRVTAPATVNVTGFLTCIE